MMNEREKSDLATVAVKSTNETGQPVEEWMEPRAGTKGNAEQQSTLRAQHRAGVSQALGRIRKASRQNKKEKFTALLHHVDVRLLRESYLSLRRDASPGADGVKWEEFGLELESRLVDLLERVHRGAYRAQPSRRVMIPKGNGKQRPLAITALEDKIVQKATLAVLNCIYEEDFLGFSYGFRPGRSQHDALDALVVGISGRKVNFILDADIRSFFDSVDQQWLIRFMEHRIGDKRVLRLIQKWLKVGVLEDGIVTQSETGTGQGAVISPLLANVYLHYVLDLWAEQWRGREARGDGRFAAEQRERAGLGKPETFDFLGFTFISGKTRKGKFLVQRKSRRDRVRAKLREIKGTLRSKMHLPVAEQGSWLGQVVRGYFAYHAVPSNLRSLVAFHEHVIHLWQRTLARRSQKGRITQAEITRLVAQWLPQPRIQHPWPNQRFAVKYPRWKPYAGKPHVRFCAGGA